MKRIEFERLAIQNFLSIGKEPVVVDFKQGINFITGENKDKEDRRNGVGKSTIPCAFNFALTGETLRKINKDMIINNVTGGTGQVDLTFSVIENGVRERYKVVRTVNPSKLFLYKNDIEVTLDSIANTTKKVLEITSATPQLLTNCIVMTLNDTVPFMTKSKIDIRKFIDDIFALEIFTQMANEVKGDYTDCKKEIDIKKVQVTEIDRSLQLIKTEVEKQQKAIAERSKLYQDRLDANKERIAVLEKELSELKVQDISKLTEKTSSIKSAIAKCRDAISALNVSIGKSESKIEFIKKGLQKLTDAEGKCPYCLQNITDHTLDLIKAEKENAATEIKAIFEDINKMSESTSKYYTALRKLEESLNSIAILINGEQQKEAIAAKKKSEFDQLTKWLKELSKDIDTIDKLDKNFEVKLEEQQKRHDDELLKLEALRATMSVIETSKFILGDDGVKSLIIKNLISLLNTKLIHYIKLLDGNGMFTFNEFFEPHIVNRKNKVCDYFNFSGAERRAMDLSCLFAFSDIKKLQGGVTYNVSFYDELFDTAIDETGVGHVVNILKDRVRDNNECIYIITHRKDVIKTTRTGEVVYLEKHNDITKRVDYRES